MSIIIRMYLPGLLWWELNEIIYLLGFSAGAVVKNLPTSAEMQAGSLGQKSPLEEKMTTCSSILAWRIPWTEDPGELQSLGLQTVRHGEHTHTYTCYTPLRTEVGAWKWKRSGSVVSDSATWWTVLYQAPLSMGFSRQEYWSGLPFLSPGDLPNRGIEPRDPTRISCIGGRRFNLWAAREVGA